MPVAFDPKDPLERRDDGWYWYDEVWCDHGPYETRDEAKAALIEYAENFL